MKIQSGASPLVRSNLTGPKASAPQPEGLADRFSPQPPEPPRKPFSIAKAVVHAGSCGTTALLSGLATMAWGAPGFFGGVALAAAAHGALAHSQGKDWKEPALNGACVATAGGMMGFSQIPALVYMGAGMATVGAAMAPQG